MKLEFTKQTIVDFFNHEGYNAIANAVETNDNAKANALLGISDWYKSQTSDRYFPQQDGSVKVIPQHKEVIIRADKIYNKMTKIINSLEV